MNIEDIPLWAKEEACRRVNARIGKVMWMLAIFDAEPPPALTELAINIAKYEQPPVDPVDEEAARIYGLWLNREADDSFQTTEVFFIKAIRRGMEMERERKA